MSDEVREKYATVWGKAWDRALRQGYDHGYAAYVADEAKKKAINKAQQTPSQEKVP